MLNADELGEKGESHFREICADAKLICNSAGRDRTGWDFIVEFPFDSPDDQSTLDKRSSPISCHIQVKTMWTTSDSFRMRLSSAERLAKEPKPAFIYIFKVNNKLDFVEAYLVHVLDETLGAILKRLRKEQVKSPPAINKKFITFRVSVIGQKLLPTGDALRSAIFEHSRPDVQSYIARKADQLKSLGFNPRPYEGKAVLTFNGIEQLVDIFLGLTKGQLSDFKTFETRFGLKLPLHEPEVAKGTIHIQPKPADHCIVAVRKDTLSPPAILQGDLYLSSLPNLSPDYRKVLIKSPLFKIIFHKGVKIDTDEEGITTGSFTIDVWINFIQMLTVLSGGAGSITITPSKSPPLSITITGKLNVNGPVNFELLLAAFETVKRLFKRAGVPERIVRFYDVASIADQIVGLGKLLSGVPDLSPLRMTTEAPDGVSIPEKVDALYVDFLSIGESTFAYCAVAKMILDRQPNRIDWTSRKIEPREIVALQNFSTDYQSFVERVKRTPGYAAVLIRYP
jgi:hypothetical protein